MLLLPRLVLLASLLVFAAATAGCPSSNACVVGAQSACACPGLSGQGGGGGGVQVCKPDGTLDACVCPAPCTPQACADVAECGAADDGCGTPLDCGACAGGKDCVANACVCPAGQVELVGACDVDECAAGTDNCDANATCTDAQPGFTCACGVGFAGDGVTCAPDPTTFVADVSARPITMIIDGVGAYQVRGLSRVAWLIGFTRSVQGNEDLPLATGVNTVPPVTVRNVRGDGASLDLIDALSAGGGTAAVRLHFSSAFGEDVEVRLAPARVHVVDATRTAAAGGTADLAEILVTADDLATVLLAEAATAFVPKPSGQITFEVGGITGDTNVVGRYLNEEVPVPAIGPGGFVTVHNVREILAVGQWAQNFHDRLFDYRSLARHQLNASDVEVSRLDGLDVMPAELRFFDPTKSYGDTLLGELVIAVGVIQPGSI